MKNILTICLLVIMSYSLFSQNYDNFIQLNGEVSQDTTIYPFNGNIMTNIGISGDVLLNSDTSFLRILVDDAIGNKYMVFETYIMLADSNNFSIYQECEESCFLTNYTPTKLIFQIINASISNFVIHWTDSIYANNDSLKYLVRNNKNIEKLTAIRNYITNNNLIWTADETRLSQLPYAKKELFFGNNYIPNGYEYYTGGIYSMFGPVRHYETCHGFVDNFDWRSRHGACLPSSPYYDGTSDSTGWITPVVCQTNGCWINNYFDCSMSEEDCEDAGGIYRDDASTCWIFAPTAQVEALTNLYYNDHIDVDLSEQYIVCRENSINGGIITRALYYYVNGGVPDEDCSPYSASPDDCDICSNPNERISIDGYQIHSNIGANELREMIMEYGPLAAGPLYYPWGQVGHGMPIVGWGTIDEDTFGDVIGIVNPIHESWYGHIYWILKQSMGTESSNNGFEYMVSNDRRPTVYTISPHINSLQYSDEDVLCRDEDEDGYYFWGLGTKPAHCPPCPDEPDGDDSNPNLGPLNDVGQCTIIGTYNADFEKGWDNWIQINTDSIDWWRHTGATPTPNTGPDSAQSGNYYIYVFSACQNCYPYKKAIIESPKIDFPDHCEGQVTFHYCMNTNLWGNNDETKLSFQTSTDGGEHWNNVWHIENHQGPQWNEKTVRFPSTVNKVRFVAITGRNYYCDIALDNITIEPYVKDASPLIISADTTWNTNMNKIYSDIIINNNATLTITNRTVKMRKDTKIFIYPGSKLIVDNAVITNYCDKEMWGGIKVLGNVNSPQTPQYQGMLELKNGARIANAICGVSLAGSEYYNSSGGIIYADSATFLNNKRAIAFYSYSNVNFLGQVVDNVSYFKKCTFIVNDNYLLPSFNNHVSLWDVKGVKFKGCSFINECTNVLYRGRAIYAESAGFTVDEFCLINVYNTNCDCYEDPIRSSFTGFDKAIEVNTTGNQYNFKVDRSDFLNNKYSVWANGVDNFSLTRLDICLDYIGYMGYAPIGIKINQAVDYTIEENSIYTNTDRPSFYLPIGINIHNADTNANVIYRNNISGLYNAISISGSNVNFLNGRNYPANGLQFQCNEFSSNDIDINIENLGIVKGVQGSATKGADNDFIGAMDYNIFNSPNYRLLYICSSLTYHRPYYFYGNITINSAANSNSCVSTLCSYDQPVDILKSGDSSFALYKKIEH